VTIEDDAHELAEVERLLSIGMCSPERHAREGCATCDKKDRAIAFVRRLYASRPAPVATCSLCGHVARAGESWSHDVNGVPCGAPIAIVRADRPGWCTPHDECGMVGCPECQK
jgi:hypothetical protein